MQKTPKEKREIEKEKQDARDKASWSEDQKKREYYYDDAHGYEKYDPEADNKDSEDEGQSGAQ